MYQSLVSVQRLLSQSTSNDPLLLVASSLLRSFILDILWFRSRSCVRWSTVHDCFDSTGPSVLRGETTD